MQSEPLIIKKRGEDGTRVISLRLPTDLLDALDDVSKETNISRNELINTILEHGLKNLEIQ